MAQWFGMVKRLKLIISSLALNLRLQLIMALQLPAKLSLGLEGLTYNNIKEEKRIKTVDWCYYPYYWQVTTVDGQKSTN